MFEKVGDRYKEFEVTKVAPLPEIHCTLRELIHRPTGAQVMHLENDDPENVFCLSFQTLPDSSNGVAHILEHTVLCGSEKYPVKDPFFAMTRRSLNTFMNAFTGSDFTCYPAASQVPHDFYNLLEVYLDAVFKPNLNELSFLQEGHRLEFSDPEDPKSPLEYKGIVFNEMKGALASPDSRLVEALYKALFPDLTYSHNSGGNPKDIPTLTYEQLRTFHKTYYNPSRCLFYFYGNMPLEKHLDFIQKHALESAKKEEPLKKIPLQKRFEKPVSETAYYPISPDQDPKDQTIYSFAWLTCHILEQEEMLALGVLNIVLMGTDAAPLKMALLKSGLCKQATAWMDTDVSEVPFNITVKGCNPENGDKLEKLIRQSLQEIADKGTDKELIKSAIHQVELHRYEITGDGGPYGLSLFMRCGLLKQHGGNPEDSLKFHSLCDTLRQKLTEDDNYFKSLIYKYYLNNPHFVRITLIPSKEMAVEEMEEERSTLDSMQQSFDQKKSEEIVSKAKELAAFQLEQEEVDVNVLPKVGLEDVPHDAPNYPLEIEKAGNLNLYYHNAFTNSLVYTSLVFPLPEMTFEELPYVQLFTLLLTQMGSGGRDYAKTLEFMQAHTGGISASLSLNRQASDPHLYFPYFYIHGKALYRKADKLFELLKDTVTSVDFTDKGRLKESITKLHSSLESGLTHNAMRYAMSLCSSGLNIPCAISNAWGGLDYFWKIRDLANHFDTQADELIAKLQSLQERMLCLKGADLVLTCDEKMIDQLRHEKFYGLQEIPSKTFSPWNGNYSIPNVPSQGRVIASPVAFSCKMFEAPPYVNPASAPLSIASNLFDNLTLHPLVREKGGAYGSHATLNIMAGTYCFYAYRDPNISKTFHAFEKAVDNLLAGKFTDEDIEEAKLEIYQDLDSPVSPGSRGHLAYSRLREGRPLEVRQAQRNRLHDTSRQDIIDSVGKYVKTQLQDATAVVFAGPELLEKENAQLKHKLKILQI